MYSLGTKKEEEMRQLLKQKIKLVGMAEHEADDNKKMVGHFMNYLSSLATRTPLFSHIVNRRRKVLLRANQAATNTRERCVKVIHFSVCIQSFLVKGHLLLGVGN